MLRFSVLGFGLSAVIGCTVLETSAAAATRVLTYNVEHPAYGIIGSYTNTISENQEFTSVRTELHVAVKAIGIPLYHQDATREERWRHHRLVGFQSTTDDDGTGISVTGQAEADRFVIHSSTNGTLMAPPEVYPSNPWSPFLLHSGTIMSTKNGRLHSVIVKDTGEVNVTLDGRAMRVRQWFVDDEKHQVVWIDDRGVIVAFQTQEKGQTINFVLKREADGNGAIAVLPEQ